MKTYFQLREQLNEAVEISADDMKVINTIKKAFPGGSKINYYSGNLEWEKSGGYAGKKSLADAQVKLGALGFKYSKGGIGGLPDGSTTAYKTFLVNKKLGWYVTIIEFYGQTKENNRYSISLAKLTK